MKRVRSSDNYQWAEPAESNQSSPVPALSSGSETTFASSTALALDATAEAEAVDKYRYW
jgi:hypothetical protein